MDVTLAYLLFYGLLLVLAGYFLPYANRNPGRILSWLIAIVTLFYSATITSQESALYRMVAIVSLQLLSMKIVVVVETYEHRNNLSFVQWCAFALGWFGMRPVLFESLVSKSLPWTQSAVKGISRMVFGLLLVYLSTLVDRLPVRIYFFSELILLAGLSLILHFGILNLATAAWRLLGVDVRELFRSPYKSKSLKEFWGKRWNVAFSEMTALIAYRPLKVKIGPGRAMVAAFLLSGLLHEVAISVPVRAGFGLPLLYFIIHAFLMYLEGASPVVKKIISHPALSHVWVFVWLVVPMPLLFHTSFVRFVLMPLRSEILSLLGVGV